VAASLWAAGPGPARAERADRNKPMVVEADREGTIDTQRGVTTFSGNALISQGTMLIRAERVEVRDPPGGARSALALGTVAQPATYRQKRDGVDEHMEAQAERIEYDAASETLRFTGQAALRRLRAGSVVDETLGAIITWNNRSETLTVQPARPTPAGACARPSDRPLPKPPRRQPRGPNRCRSSPRARSRSRSDPSRAGTAPACSLGAAEALRRAPGRARRAPVRRRG
jgi:lipopolysaccharide export system protein LptA